MKLCYLANLRMPTEKAHGLQVANMCQAFADTGVEVTLVVPKRRNPLDKEDSYRYYGVRNNFNIVQLPVLDLVGIIPKLGFWVELLTFYMASRRHLKKNYYDIVYTREPVLAFRLPQAVLEIHTLSQKPRWIDRRVWSKVRRIVAVTGHLKRQLEEWGVNDGKVLVAHDGVDIKRFGKPQEKREVRKRLGLSQERLIFGYVGMLKTMGMEKGITTALEALRSLTGNFAFLVVGGAPEDIEHYKQEAKHLKLNDRVIFSGRVPHTTVPDFLQACDILIAPFPDNRHYRYYMSPLKIFEYMASGRPIVASELPSLREILNENNCRFIMPTDSHDLAEKINELAEDQGLSERISLQAKEDVLKYTWRERARLIIDFIK